MASPIALRPRAVTTRSIPVMTPFPPPARLPQALVGTLAAALSVSLATGDPRSSGSMREGETGPESGLSERSRGRLVVATFDEQGVSPGLGDIVADLVTQSIDPAKVQLVERRQVQRVLEEQIVAASDLSQPGEAMRYGRLAESRYVLLGSVYRVDGVYYVSARVVDVETGIVSEGARATSSFRTVDEMVSSIPGLVRAIGLCTECPAGTAASSVDGVAQPALRAPSTVRDYIERIGDQSSGQVTIDIDGGERRVAVGQPLRFRVTSPRMGYLSLFVVDANGSVSMLLPNSVVGSLALQPGVPQFVPSGTAFSIVAAPPAGMTRVKAVVTRDPLPLMGSPDAAGLLRRVTLNQPVSARESDSQTQERLELVGAELEFLVTDRAVPDLKDPATPKARTGAPSALKAPELLHSALARLRNDPRYVTGDDASLLRWPLSSPFVEGVDMGISRGIEGGRDDTLIAVIDADFDPDDPVLAHAFRRIDPATRERLREEIRRNGHAPFRHGNRVASLIAGEADWLPSAAPGAALIPIRVTTALEGPDYRVVRGRAGELLEALRTALNAGCKIVNLSLSIPLSVTELESFAADPVWDRLEDAGVLVVCAAGNSGDDLDEKPTYPACLPRSNILCVGAVGPDGHVARWSSGGSCTGASSVDLFAPGSLIAVSDGGGEVGMASGTSYASALATGVAARWVQSEPGLGPAALIRRMMEGARRTPQTASACRSGIIQDHPSVRR
jgi:TolB-like protein